MKKIISLLLAFTMLCSMAMFTSCGGSDSKDGCTICGKRATHKFQGSEYCTTHYNKAVKWAIDHVD